MRVIKDLIKQHEGLRLKPYRCTANKLTIGYGRNIEDKGISEGEAENMLNNDIVECIADLGTIFPGYANFLPNQKSALINMRFQLGPNRFRQFKRMIDAIKDNNWVLAMMEARDSKWYKQVPNRAKEVTEMFLEE